MKTILPLLYSLLLFVILFLLTLYLFGQVQQTQKVEQRLNLLERKLTTNPSCGETYYFLGQIYLGKKDYSKALRFLKNALKYWNYEDKIGLGSLYNTIGFTYFKMQNYSQARNYYKQAITLLPDYTLALNNLGLAYETDKQYDYAYHTYLQVLRYDKKNYTALVRKQEVKSKFAIFEKTQK